MEAPQRSKKQQQKKSGFTSNGLCCAGTILGAWIMFCSIQLDCDRDILWPWTSGNHGQIPFMMKKV